MSESPAAWPSTPPLTTPRPATRSFVLLVALATAVIVSGAVIGFMLWHENQPSVTGLSDRVMESMNESLSNDPHFSKTGLHIKSITVMHMVGTMFEGYATAATNREINHDVQVHIAYDGDKLWWNTDPGSFAFVAQEELAHGGG